MQVEARLPANKEIFSGLSLLKPSKVLSHVHRASFSQLPFHLLLADTSETEEQYRKSLLQPWSEEDVFQEQVLEGAVGFWVGVYDFKDCTVIYVYRQLASYALACLSTPVSNAFVERVFPCVNAIKTERRNRLGIKMVEAILRIRTTVMTQNRCCKDMVITRAMLERFN